MSPSTVNSISTEHDIVSIRAVDGYGLSCRYWPASEPYALLVIVHGVISHSLWMESVARQLAKSGIAVLGMDRRGSGLNRESRGDAPDVQTLLDDLDAVMHWALAQSLPTHLCGFCWGSNYVVNYLPICTQPIRSTILITPSVFASDLIKQQAFETGSSAEATEEPVTPIDQFTDGPKFESFIKPDPLRLRKVSKRFNHCVQEFADGLWMKFLKLEVPCLTLLADRDTVVDNTATEQLFARLKVSRKQLHVLSGSHGIQFDQPDEITAHITRWVNTQ